MAGAPTNSGRHCTVIKRILCQGSVADRFLPMLLERVRRSTYGDLLPSVAGTRHEALEPIRQGVRARFGAIGQRALSERLRHPSLFRFRNSRLAALGSLMC